MRLALLRGASSFMTTSRRLLSTSAAAAAAATLEEQLQRAPWLQLLQVPGQGRGLFAAADLEQGMVVHEEAPMLAAPSPHALGTTCHQCLQPLHPGAGSDVSSDDSRSRSAGSAGSLSSSGGGIPFCSAACSAAAEASWAAAAAAADLRPLQQACRESGSKFPLMAAQLALMRVQAAQRAAGGLSDPPSGGGSAGAAGEEEPARGDPLTQLRHLCFANVAEPPQPWVELHALLLQGLRTLFSGSNGGGGGSSSSGGGCSGSSGSSSSSTAGGPALGADWLERELSLGWFCDALARLHINSFRVDTVPPLDSSDPAALLRAASASLAGAAQPAHAAGSAAYLLGSMLNHSCEPNCDVAFPRNSGVVALTAARDIARGEQLTISYVDLGLPLAARREALRFGYGFTCRCPRCVEEAGVEGAPH